MTKCTEYASLSAGLYSTLDHHCPESSHVQNRRTSAHQRSCCRCRSTIPTGPHNLNNSTYRSRGELDLYCNGFRPQRIAQFDGTGARERETIGLKPSYRNQAGQSYPRDRMCTRCAQDVQIAVEAEGERKSERAAITIAFANEISLRKLTACPPFPTAFIFGHSEAL